MIMNSLATWKSFKLPLIKLESKDMSTSKSLSNVNIKTTFNSFNGSKDTTISTAEIGVNNMIQGKEEAMFLQTLVLLTKMSSRNPLTVVDKSSLKINFLAKKYLKFSPPKSQHNQGQKLNKGLSWKDKKPSQQQLNFLHLKMVMVNGNNFTISKQRKIKTLF